MKDKIQMIKVESSNIHAVGYEEDTKILFIAFKYKDDIKIYTYEGITKSQYNLLFTAESVGKMFHAFIRGKYNDQLLRTNSPYFLRFEYISRGGQLY